MLQDSQQNAWNIVLNEAYMIITVELKAIGQAEVKAGFPLGDEADTWEALICVRNKTCGDGIPAHFGLLGPSPSVGVGKNVQNIGLNRGPDTFTVHLCDVRFCAFMEVLHVVAENLFKALVRWQWR